MKIAVIGSRNITSVDIGRYLPEMCDEIISGGAAGVDRCAEEYARNRGIRCTVILPKYERYGRAAPIIRNKEIVECADRVYAFWDGCSKGTLSVIQYSQQIGKPCEVIVCK